MPGFYSEEDLQRASSLGFDDFNNLPPELQDAATNYISNPKNQSRFHHAQQEYAGTNYGDRMRAMAMQNSPMATVDHAGIDKARALGAQSYGKQQQALGLIREQAMGGGPSAANAQTAMAQDAQMRGMSGLSGGNLRGALMGGSQNALTAQGGAARGQEIGAAQQGFGASAGQMRGQSLQDYGQGLQSAYGASALNLQQQDQDLKRRLAFEKLGFAGNRMDVEGRNALQNKQQGFNFGQQDRNDAYISGAVNAGASTFGQGASQFGSGSNRDRGGKSWSDWNP